MTTSQIKTEEMLALVEMERDRQRHLVARKVIPWPCEDPQVPNGIKLGVLGEEFGEVCKALNDDESTEDLKKELIQVAAVAVAWAESL